MDKAGFFLTPVEVKSIPHLCKHALIFLWDLGVPYIRVLNDYLAMKTCINLSTNGLLSLLLIIVWSHDTEIVFISPVYRDCAVFINYFSFFVYFLALDNYISLCHFLVYWTIVAHFQPSGTLPGRKRFLKYKNQQKKIMIWLRLFTEREKRILQESSTFVLHYSNYYLFPVITYILHLYVLKLYFIN